MITGSIVALVTPMFEDSSIDWESLNRLIEFHIANDTDAISVVGTTGEASTVSMQEHFEVMARAIKVANGRIPIIAGTGANSTAEAISLTQEAKSLNADACLIVTPYYNKPPQRGLIAHHEAIAAAVDIPQILYNVPGRTACDMLPDTVSVLADVEQVVGVKEATGDLVRSQELIDKVGERIAVYSGDDMTAYELILQGGQGNISVTANVVPKKMHELCMLALAGKAEEAKALNDSLKPLHSAMFVEANPIPVKWALHEMGYMQSGIRLPLVALANQERSQLKNTLKEYDLL